MKVILSRKGMDSATGGIASPILPDGTLLSLPIPEIGTKRTYAQLNYYGQSYEDIIRQISPRYNFDKKGICHLDPDIFDNLDIVDRPDNWKPAYGQCDASASHLDNYGVGVGDIFLFYGMFRQTEYDKDNSLRYVRGAPIEHIIFGYMKIGEVLRDKSEIQRRYPWHPHAVNAERKNNRLYLPNTYGTFNYHKKLLLSKEGQPQKRLWELPAFFAEDGISISWQGENRPIRHENHAELLSTCRGQEFVVVADHDVQEKNLKEWVENIIKPELKKQMINHIMYPDGKGMVYCRKENDLVKLDFERCRNCPLCGGSAQGEGIECYYEDAFTDRRDFIPCRGKEHMDEKARITALIKNGIVDKTAVRR